MSAEIQVTLSIPCEGSTPVEAVKDFIATMQDGNRPDFVYRVQGDVDVLVDAEGWKVTPVTDSTNGAS